MSTVVRERKQGFTRRGLLLRLAAGAVACSAATDVLHAQAFPVRPITIIVPYGAGGPTDAIARILAQRMRDSLGQPVIVENIPGASGSIGVGRAIRSAPDGYTICLGTWPTHVLNGTMLTLPYDIRAAMDPIAQVVSDPPLIVSRRNFPANDLAGFVEWLKANPDKTTLGTGGLGSTSQVIGLFFQKRTGTRFQFVPYRNGIAVALQDMLAGHIDFLFSVAANAVPLLRTGDIKGYAVTSSERLGVVPEIPTVDEAGLPGFYMSNWHGIWAPKGVSPDIRNALNAAVIETLADPSVRRHLVDLGQEIAPRDRQTPEGLAALQKDEIEKWWPIIREAGLKLE
jgi:tripartite-type tricarboxylate transporter receptor subunit TctC